MMTKLTSQVLRPISLVLILLCLSGCRGRNLRPSSAAEHKPIAQALVELPSPPEYITSAEEQARYMIRHFWDRIDLSSRDLLSDREAYEEAIANYLGLLTSFKSHEMREELLHPLNNLVKEPLLHTLGLYRKYLYEADSPMLNEDFFRIVLEWAIASPRVERPHQDEASVLLALINKNKVGDQATDFLYTTEAGQIQRLSYISTPYTLVIFASSGCASCRDVLRYASSLKELAELHASGKLTMLVVYIGDTSAEELAQETTVPRWAIKATDTSGEITQAPLYDIKASPTCYLLGRSRRVLLKDTGINQALSYIKSH